MAARGDIDVIRKATHWLRVVCTHPLHSTSAALLFRLLRYTNETLLDYKKGPSQAGITASSIAEVAADSSNNQSINAKAYIASVYDQLLTVCILASYLTGEGDPRNAPPLHAYPNKVELVPSWDIAANEKLMRPVQPFSLRLDERTPDEREMLMWTPRFQFIMSTAKRFYYDETCCNGAVLGALFLVLVVMVPEIRAHVAHELECEGVPAEKHATLFAYIADEMRALVQAPMDFVNAKLWWNTAWGSISDTIHKNDFDRMVCAVQARENMRSDVQERIKKSTENKRRSRAASRQRKKTKVTEDSEAEMAERLVEILGNTNPNWEDAEEVATDLYDAVDAGCDDGDDDGDMSGIIFS